MVEITDAQIFAEAYAWAMLHGFGVDESLEYAKEKLNETRLKKGKDTNDSRL